MDSKQILVVAAMAEELQGLLEVQGASVLYTGLGKVNAAYQLTRELSLRASRGAPVKKVINFGTAGSSVFKTHELVEILQFVQRDMDVSPLGIPRGVTPFDSLPAVLEVTRCLPELPSGSCGTGDSFEILHPETQFKSRDEEQQVSFFADVADESPAASWAAPSLLLPYYDVVDMECYALAKVCAQERIAFCAIKYISDGADASASNDWQANLPKAAAAFAKIYPTLSLRFRE